MYLNHPSKNWQSSAVPTILLCRILLSNIDILIRRRGRSGRRRDSRSCDLLWDIPHFDFQKECLQWRTGFLDFFLIAQQERFKSSLSHGIGNALGAELFSFHLKRLWSKQFTISSLFFPASRYLKTFSPANQAFQMLLLYLFRYSASSGT